MSADPDAPSESGLLSREEVDELMEQIKAGRESPEVRAEIDREYDRTSGKELSRGKPSGEKAAIVDKHVDKYMGILGIEGERPDVRVGNWPFSAWGGTSWHPLRPYTSVIRLQKHLFQRPTALESAIAHELVHHQNNLSITDDEIRTLLETGKYPDWWEEDEGHGKAFQEKADRVNVIMGPGFVKEKAYTKPEEEEAIKARAKKSHLGKQLLIGLGGGALALLVLRQVIRRRPSPAPSPPADLSRRPQMPPKTPPPPRFSPDRGMAPLPRSLLPERQTNERGSYGPPKIQRVARTNERGSYGRKQRSTP